MYAAKFNQFTENAHMRYLCACTQSCLLCIDMTTVDLIAVSVRCLAYAYVGTHSQAAQLQRLSVLLRFAASVGAGLVAALQPLVDYSQSLWRKGDSFLPESTSQMIGKWSVDYVALDCLLDKFAQVPPDVMQEV